MAAGAGAGSGAPSRGGDDLGHDSGPDDSFPGASGPEINDEDIPF